MIETYFTPKEAMEILKVGRCTIYKLLTTGELQSIRVGKQIRIPESAIQKLKERQLWTPNDITGSSLV